MENKTISRKTCCPAKSPTTSSDIPEKYISQEAEEFLDSLKLSKAKPPSSKTLLQLLVASLILSARMSKNISVRSFLLLSDKYDGCEFEKLNNSSWNELCDVIPVERGGVDGRSRRRVDIPIIERRPRLLFRLHGDLGRG